MDKVFLSQNNYGILHDIIKTTIFNRLNYDIDNDRKANFLNKLMIIMKQIYEDRNKFNISEDLSMIEKIKQLNKYTLDFIIPHFSQIINHSIQNKKTTKEIQTMPKISSYGERNTIHTRMQNSSETNDVDVLKNFNTMSNDRTPALNKPESIDFSLPIDNKSFPMEKYEEIQKQRDLELKNLEQEKNSKNRPQPKVEDKPLEKVTVSGIDSHSTMIKQAESMVEFDNFNTSKEDRDRKFEARLAELSKERDVIFKTNSFDNNKNYDTVNSKMAVIEEFSGEKTKLQEREDGVYLDKNIIPEQPKELFKVDPTIEKQLLERTTKNDLFKESDLMIKQPVNTEIYTEYITVDSRDDIKLSKQPEAYFENSEFTVYFPWRRFKNIKEITLVSAIVPSASAQLPSPNSIMVDEPYLLVSVLELGGSLYNSNNKNLKYFGKIYNEYNGQTAAANKTIKYKVDTTSKMYNIHNLSSLEKMTITISNYKGVVFNNFKFNVAENPYQCFSFTFKIDYTVGDANEHINSNMV